MPKKALVAFALVLGFGLSGLSVPAWPAQDVVRPSGMALETIEEKTSRLTLEEATQRALQDSPKLSVFAHEVRAREFEAMQAGVRPNPELSVEVENVAGNGEFSGTDSAETTVRISQLLETGGKRERRREVGNLEMELAEREYELARAEVLAETTTAFLSVLAAQARLSLAEEQADLAERVLKAVEDRIEAGKAAAIEGARFRSLISEARLRQEKSLQDLTAARRRLAVAWGSGEVDFQSVDGDLEEVRAIPDWPELVSGFDGSPEAALRKSAVRSADRILSLERANRLPDLTFSLGARNDQDTGDNALVAEISVPLPVFDRNQGAIGAARVRQAKAKEAERAARLQLRSEVSDAWQKARSAQREADMLREEILPAARETFEAVTYGYRAGKFGFLEVLDAERTLFDTRSRYVDALTALRQAVADLERLLGVEISSDLNSVAYKGANES